MTEMADDRRPRLLTGEEMTQTVASLDAARQEAKAKEQALKPFSDGLAYDQIRVIQMAKFHLEQGVSHFFEFGKCLMLLKENESWQTFANLLEEEFGISERTARNYLRFALVAAKFPRFKDFFTKQRMMHKGLALLEGVKDPENDAILSQFEDTGEWGDLQAGDLLDKSVRELKSENRRLRREKDLLVAGATKDLADENERLRTEVQTLEARLAPEPGAKEAKKLLAAGGALIAKAREVFGRVDWPLVLADGGLKQVAAGHMDAADRLGGYLQTVIFGGLADDDER